MRRRLSRRKFAEEPDTGATGDDRIGRRTVRAMLNAAPGNGMPIGGVKVIAENGWFAARPSGTEEVYKIYAESFRSQGSFATDPTRCAEHHGLRVRERKSAFSQMKVLRRGKQELAAETCDSGNHG